jgi:hypothetical protein
MTPCDNGATWRRDGAMQQVRRNYREFDKIRNGSKPHPFLQKGLRIIPNVYFLKYHVAKQLSVYFHYYNTCSIMLSSTIIFPDS